MSRNIINCIKKDLDSRVIWLFLVQISELVSDIFVI